FSRAAYVVLFALRAFPTRRSSDLLFQMIRCRLQSPGSLMKNHFQICIVFHQSFGSQCLDTAHTCCHTCFGNNLEGSDGCSIVHVCSTAKFLGEFSHADNADDIAVLFTKQSLRPCLFGLFDRKVFYLHRKCISNGLVYDIFYVFDFFRRQCGEMGKVKTKSCRIHVGTSLLYVRSKYSTQCFLKQMSRTVVSCGESSVLLIDFQHNRLSGTDHAFYCISNMRDLSAQKFLHVFYYEFKASIFGSNHTFVCILSTACCIERSLFYKNRTFHAFGQRLSQFVLCRQHRYPGAVCQCLISNKGRCHRRVDGLIYSHVCYHIVCYASCCMCCLLLILHVFLVFFL